MKKLYICLSFVMFINLFCFSQQKALDSLIPNIETLSDSIVFDSASDQLRQLWIKENYDDALVYANKLLDISKQLTYDKGTGEAFNHLGIIYSITYKDIKALQNYDKAIYYFKKVNNLRGLAKINNNKSIIEQRQGNLEKSINYLLEAKLYFERLNDSVSLANIYNNIGNVYRDLNDLDLAKKSYQKTIALKRSDRSNKISMSISTLLNNLALLYTDLKKNDSAKVLFKEALEISKKNNANGSLSSAYNGLGSLAFLNNDYEKARKYYDSSYVAGEKVDHKEMQINTKQQLGLIAIKTKKFGEAENLLAESREKIKKLGINPLLLKNYKYTASLDSARGHFSEAFEWQKKYQKLSNQNALAETTKKIDQTEARFKSEMEQLKLIDEQEKREQKTKEELFRYRLFTYISLSILVTIFMFMIFIIKTRKERKTYITQLNESNQVKNKLFSIISHDLKNEIHGLDGSLNLLKDNAISTEEFQEIVPLLANRTHQTSILLNNLLNWSKSQMKELNAKPSAFDIKQVIDEKFTFFRPKAEQKQVKLINKLDPTMVFVDKDMISIVSQNLIANAIKFCNPGDSITLLSEEKGNNYQICFQDTGIGIDPKNIDKLFAEDTFTTEGTQKETGTGLGLRICKELVELNNGSIMVKSKMGEGSTFCITIPKTS